MTATAEYLEDSGFDFSDLTDETTEASSGPLSGSRSTRRSSGGAAATARPRANSRIAKRLEALQKKLSSEMFQAGAMVGMGMPVTGYYVCQESDSFTKAVVELASKRPEWVDALENVAAIQPGITIGKTVLGIGAAMAVDRGRIEPDKRFLMFLGVYSAWEAVSGDEPQREGQADYGVTYSAPPAAAFQPL